VVNVVVPVAEIPVPEVVVPVVSVSVVPVLREAPVASASLPTPRVSSDGGAPPPRSYLRLTDKSGKYVDYAWPAVKNAINLLPGIDRTLYIYDDEDFPRHYVQESDKVLRLPLATCPFPYTVANFLHESYDKAPNYRHTFVPPK